MKEVVKEIAVERNETRKKEKEREKRDREIQTHSKKPAQLAADTHTHGIANRERKKVHHRISQ